MSIFRGFQGKFKQPSRQENPDSVIWFRVNWIRRLRQSIFGANSKTNNRVEQSVWVRKTARFVEVTVETDKVVQVENIVRAVSDPATSDQDRHDGAISLEDKSWTGE
jgi:hypothetical protein